MQAQVITKQQAVLLVAAHKVNNNIFGVCFTKKDGSLRTMACRFNVTSRLTTNGTPSTTSHIPKYITVFDMRKAAYRNVNLDTLLYIVSAGFKYHVQ